ncbi:roadblock/LC7 domain-containing protein [Actinomadura sp. NPDC023710]|uniref:roadblock/LC7 domain-containing protein n=1 Tax=Actinomadura sp. NPDC023710 TaxID=3158219 RepID=UPI0033ECAF33
MTIPLNPTVSPSPAFARPAGAQSGGSSEGLGWLLDNFRAEVPGIRAAFLVGRDGLVLAASGLTTDEADHAAAATASTFSIAGAAGKIVSPCLGAVQQIIVEHDAGYTIVMRTPDQPHDIAAESASNTTRDPLAPQAGDAAVGCVLGVLAGPDAQTRLIANGMSTLIESVARHMVIAIRTSTSSAANTETAPWRVSTTHVFRDGAGQQDKGAGDEQ